MRPSGAILCLVALIAIAMSFLKRLSLKQNKKDDNTIVKKYFRNVCSM